LCSLAFSNPAYPASMLTWEECVRRTVDNNPDLAAALEKVKQASADKDINLSAAMPEISTYLDGKRGKTSGEKITGSYSYGLTGRQLLFDGFKTASEVSAAVKIFESRRHSYNVVSSNVRLDLRNAFVGLLRAQELAGITEGIAERRRQNLDLVRLRYESGREHKGALMTAEADFAQAEFEVSQAKRGVLLWQRELSGAMGVFGTGPIQAEGEFSLSDDHEFKPDLVSLAETTPFLKELMLRKDAARYNLNSREADFMPKVYLGASMARSEDRWPPRDDGWSAGLSVSLPIFEGGRRIAEVSKASSQLEEARAVERSGYDSVLVGLERYWKNLQDSIQNITVQKKFLDAATERAKITRSQYEIGLASFNDWIIIEDNLVRAEKTHLNAQADMLVAEAYWIQAIGGTLEYDQE
jgi:outer membrane protein TolC